MEFLLETVCLLLTVLFLFWTDVSKLEVLYICGEVSFIFFKQFAYFATCGMLESSIKGHLRQER